MGNMPSKVLLFCALGALLPLASRAENPREIGTVVTTQGVVSIVDAAGATREAGRRSPVHEGETVVVAPDGFASFRMVDNAHLSLGPATELVFSTYRHDGKSGTKDSVVLNLKLGCFRARAGAAGSGRRDDYRVDTPFASIDVEASFHGASHAAAGSSVQARARSPEAASFGLNRRAICRTMLFRYPGKGKSIPSV